MHISTGLRQLTCEYATALGVTLVTPGMALMACIASMASWLLGLMLLAMRLGCMVPSLLGLAPVVEAAVRNTV